MRLPTITLAKKGNKKDRVVLNQDDAENIAAYRKRGYTEEIALDDNGAELAPEPKE